MLWEGRQGRRALGGAVWLVVIIGWASLSWHTSSCSSLSWRDKAIRGPMLTMGLQLLQGSWAQSELNRTFVWPPCHRHGPIFPVLSIGPHYTLFPPTTATPTPQTPFNLVCTCWHTHCPFKANKPHPATEETWAALLPFYTPLSVVQSNHLSSSLPLLSFNL